MSSDAETSFDALTLSPALLSVVKELGYERPRPIQASSIPPLLAGKDLIGQSKTGSGKTAAFGLPLLQRLDPARRELSALVVCPTRELSAQVARELRKLGRKLPGLSVAVLSGGEPLRDQKNALEQGAQVVVGTPGRLLDHLQRKTLKLHRVSLVVLDEADRMLEMGFEQDVRKLLKALPPEHQTALFSATFPESILALSAKYQREPVRVTVAEESEAGAGIEQLVVHVAPAQKLEALRWVFQRYPHESALVFANLKATVAEVEAGLLASGVSVASLHGDLEQYDRDRVMAKFRNGSTRVLVATDVAARGIDLSALDLVVNFELPSQPEVYVHRIGRTGRSGRSGTAVALCAREEQPKLEAIEAFQRSTLSPIARDKSAVREKTPLAEREAKMETLRLSGGRKDKLRPGDILGALTGEAGGLAGTDIGKIEIHERFAYVAVAKQVSQRALSSLNAGRIKGLRIKAELVK